MPLKLNILEKIFYLIVGFKAWNAMKEIS